MSEITGVVEAVSTKFGKYAVMIDSNWYSTKPEWLSVQPTKGDKITFDHGEEGQKYLKKVQILEKGAGGSTSTGTGSAATSGKSYSRGAFPIDPLDGTRSIIRQNSVTNAVNYANTVGNVDGTLFNADQILEIARVFEAYSAGDLDRIAAEEAMKDIEGDD